MYEGHVDPINGEISYYVLGSFGAFNCDKPYYSNLMRLIY
jgi:hypothetical protein